MAILYDNQYGDFENIRKKLLVDLKKELEEKIKKEGQEDIWLKKDIEEFFKPEKFEIAQGVTKELGYPQPISHYRMIWESPALALEEVYFWFINFYSPNVEKIEKLRDIFSASPQSTFFGSSQQRLGMTQDRVEKYLQAIGTMTNHAMSFLRELREVLQVLEFYEKAAKDKKGNPNGHELTLRDLWTTQVEGGSQNPQSVIGLSTQVGFSILPNLFFGTWIEGMNEKGEIDEGEIEKQVDALRIGNRIVKDTLKRKLTQYFVWRKKTLEENIRRKKYNIVYLNQQLSVIRMYVSWLKPYLYYVRNIQMSYRSLEKAELITSFENALAELEVLIIPKTKDKYNPCILLTVNYISKPEMSYSTPDYQQRGPKHTGHVEVNVRAYSWSDEQIGFYKQLLRKEDEKLLSFVDVNLEKSLKEVDEFLSGVLSETELEYGLKEKEEKKEKKDEKKDKKKKSGSIRSFLLSPFELEPGEKLIDFSFAKDITDFITNPFGILGDDEKDEFEKITSSKKKAGSAADNQAWLAYNLFKKTHGMLAW